MRGAMEEIERLTRERDDAWEERDAWHARVAHIAQALGMQPPPSGDWRDVVFAEVEQAVASQRAELEAARAKQAALLEAGHALVDEVAWVTNGDLFLAEPRHPLTAPTRKLMEAMEDAAKAGKAVE